MPAATRPYRWTGRVVEVAPEVRRVAGPIFEDPLDPFVETFAK